MVPVVAVGECVSVCTRHTLSLNNHAVVYRLQQLNSLSKVYLNTGVSIFLLRCRKKKKKNTDLYIKQTTGRGYKR